MQRSYGRSTLPANWKVAYVIALFKKGTISSRELQRNFTHSSEAENDRAFDTKTDNDDVNNDIDNDYTVDGASGTAWLYESSP